MNFHEDRQAQLLDEYLTALQQNPNAPIPNGLEPEIAAFARMMLSPEATNEHEPMAQERVWQGLNTSAKMKTTNIIQEHDIRMSNLKEKNKNTSTMSGWLPLAATAAIAIVVSLTLGVFLFRDNEPNQADQPDSAVVTATFVPTATAIQSESVIATPLSQISATPTFLPSAMPPTALPPNGETILEPTPSAMLICDFDGEFTLRINQNEIAPDDTLIIDGAVYNTDTALLIVEIFGGFLTNDDYQTITEIDTMPSRLQVLARVEGTDYPAGSYLVGLDLRDDNGEILSRCSLPVVFTD